MDGIRHPLLLESSLESLSNNLASKSKNASQVGYKIGVKTPKILLQNISDFLVSFDLKIGLGTRLVVISGPNIVGKTVSMKSLGLASLMSKARMHLPGVTGQLLQG